ncbi:M20/M25/M40 family metallo-hydrolase [Comamonas resistens]|uniref:M20/M25/M40 family metallo-hydrolase n=1 Tax=Comamonas resistens TaxID=3046670 RepID=UPI0038995367
MLLYTHHDVQPVRDDNEWKSSPFQPTKRDGRLYGRGAAAEKAGVAVHLAVMFRWFVLMLFRACSIVIKLNELRSLTCTNLCP